MQKSKLILALIGLSWLIFRPGALTYGGELRVNCGYELLFNDLHLSVLNFPGLHTSINTPSGMYTGEINYDFSEKYSVKAGLALGTNHLGKYETDIWGLTITDTLNQNNSSWNLEGVAKIPLGKNFIGTGFAGYGEYNVTDSNTINIGPEQINMELKQSINGVYVGTSLNFVTKSLELGTSYQIMLNPQGHLRLALYNHHIGLHETDPVNLDSLNCYVFSVYFQVKFDKRWGIGTGCKFVNTDYTVSGIGVSCNTYGIWLKIIYYV